jgi:hypothetical protein
MYALSAMGASARTANKLGTNPRILPATVRSSLADAVAVGMTNFIWLFLPLVRFVGNANEVTVEGELR